MDYLFNDANQLRTATLDADNFVSSSTIARTDRDPKEGSGIVKLVGPYTGAHDRRVDVELLDGDGDASQTSAPIFTGTGNGTMSQPVATLLPAQDITVTLDDLGVLTTSAVAPFQGKTLIAKTAGDMGNAVLITSSDAGLTRTTAPYALRDNLQSGTNSYVGDQWNFGAGTLKPDGTIDDATTPRISFGDDPQVYRPYRKFDPAQSQFVYSFSPPIVRDVPAGTVVKSVTGNHAVTISDGGAHTPETYTGVTLYSICSQIRDGSAIVQFKPSDVIANDKRPNGDGVNDLALLTASFVLGVVADGSSYIKAASINFHCSADSPTEGVTIQCIDNSVVGGEVWTVEGDISAGLPTAVTGVAYASGGYSFLIPQQLPPASIPASGIQQITVTMDLMSRSADETQVPMVCPQKLLLGPSAKTATYHFVYKRKPPEACKCDVERQGGIDLTCLGIGSEGGTTVDNPQLVLRKQRLLNLLKDHIEANTSENGKADDGDILMIRATYPQIDGVIQALADAESLEPVPRVNSATMAVGDLMTFQGWRYMALSAGALASSAPDYTSAKSNGATITDGAVALSALGQTALVLLDATIDDWDDAMSELDTVTNPQRYPVWSPGMSVIIGSGSRVGTRVVPTEPSGKYYEASEPSSAGAATTGQVEPVWQSSGTTYETVSDASTIQWEVGSIDSLEPGQVSENYLDKWRARTDQILYAAGLDPVNFDSANTAGNANSQVSACWRDYGDSDYWFETKDGLTPYQIGHPYVSVKQCADADGNPTYQPTGEFGMILDFGCAEKLEEGDAFDVTINVDGSVSATTSYQLGDNIIAGIAHADPITFAGGVTGDNTLTWRIASSDPSQSFDPYLIDVTAPTAYSDAGLAFEITLGGIPFGLGAQFSFSIESGHFRYRVDGGSWSASTLIGPTSLADGLALAFIGGASPSWVGGDAFSYLAEATNGPDQIKVPTGGSLSWDGDIVIDVTPADPSQANNVLALFDHTIDPDASIVLTSSNDGVGKPALTIPLTYRARDLWVRFAPASRATWHLTITGGTGRQTLFYAYLGQPRQLFMGNGIQERGMLTKRLRLPTATQRRAFGGDVEHTCVAQDSFDAWFDALCWSRTYDDNTFGVIQNFGNVIGGTILPGEPECALVEYDDDSLEVDDEQRGFQMRNPAGMNRLLDVKLTLSPRA